MKIFYGSFTEQLGIDSDAIDRIYCDAEFILVQLGLEYALEDFDEQVKFAIEQKFLEEKTNLYDVIHNLNITAIIMDTIREITEKAIKYVVPNISLDIIKDKYYKKTLKIIGTTPEQTARIYFILKSNLYEYWRREALRNNLASIKISKTNFLCLLENYDVADVIRSIKEENFSCKCYKDTSKFGAEKRVGKRRYPKKMTDEEVAEDIISKNRDKRTSQKYLDEIYIKLKNGRVLEVTPFVLEKEYNGGPTFMEEYVDDGEDLYEEEYMDYNFWGPECDEDYEDY
jgi:hypothetical protein